MPLYVVPRSKASTNLRRGPRYIDLVDMLESNEGWETQDDKNGQQQDSGLIYCDRSLMDGVKFNTCLLAVADQVCPLKLPLKMSETSTGRSTPNLRFRNNYIKPRPHSRLPMID